MDEISLDTFSNGNTGSEVRNIINNNFSTIRDVLGVLNESLVKIITYTGDGTTTRSIDVGFTPRFALLFGGKENRLVVAFKTMLCSAVFEPGLEGASIWNTDYWCSDSCVQVGTNDRAGHGLSSTNENSGSYTIVCWR